MTKIFDLIAGNREEVKHHIENLQTFKMWQLEKTYDDQVDTFMSRMDTLSHIGAVTYMGESEEGVVIHAAFVAITRPNFFQ